MSLCTSLPGYAQSAQQKRSQTQQEMAQIKRDISALEAKHKATSQEQQKLEKALQAQARKLAQAAKHVEQSKQALAANETHLAELGEQKTKLDKRLKENKQSLDELLTASYKIRPYSDLRLLLGKIGDHDMGRALTYSRYFQKDQLSAIHAIGDDLQKLHELKKTIQDEHQTLIKTRDKHQKNEQALQQERRQQQALMSKLNQQSASEKSRMQTLKGNQKNLDTLLHELTQVIAKQEAEARAKAKAEAAARAKAQAKAQARAQAKSRDHTPPKTTKPRTRAPATTNIPTPDGPFQNQRGKLMWPLRGRYRQASSGLFINASEGSQVKAVAAGQVIYADWLRGYGLMIIINHGGGWMSLYGGNETLKAHMGDQVKVGTVIATSGASMNSHTGVYFAIRHQGKATNPLPWLQK